jgi:Family of unknown function (DUF5681)
MGGQAPKSPNYRKPPVEHQFKKGQSGNLNGRPPKKKRPSVSSGGSGGIFDRIAEIALEEAVRPITVREGGRVEQVPAIQAVIRSMFRSAGHGDTKSQRQLLELTTRAEANRAIAARDGAAWLIEYQAWALKQMADHDRRGVDPPKLYPHPDDIDFDFGTGEVTIDGPLSEEQAGAEKAALEHVVLGLKRYLEIEHELQNDPNNKKLKKELAEHQLYMDYMNRRTERNIRRQARKLARDAMKPRRNEREDKATLPVEGRKSDQDGES